MMTRKLLVRTVYTRRGLHAFENEVNAYFNKGWEPITIEINRRWTCTSCFAVIALPTRCDCQCPCCTGLGIHNEDCECACDCCVIHSSHATPSQDEDIENEHGCSG